MSDYPEMMQGIQLHQENNNLLRVLLALKKESMPLAPLKEDDILIKMQAAPCNPSDIAFMRGMYNVKKTLPRVLGFEGTGIIEQVGKKSDPKLIGQRVSCFTQTDEHGTWADYFVTKTENCLLIKDEMPVDQAACFFVNPFTAFTLFQQAMNAGMKGLIQNAAAGQVGRFISVFARKENIPVIHVVRKEKHVKELQESGEAHVLNMQDEGFEVKLREMAHDLGTNFAFDAVGGKLAGQMFNAMTKQSEMIIYGGLSGEQISAIDAMDLIFKQKKISGFDLNQWMAKHGKSEILELSERLQNMIIEGDITTHIQMKVDADKILKGLTQYIKNMSGGKVLIEF